MNTSVVNQEDISEKTINQAAKILQKEGLIAFPTETVYGLGANGLNVESYKKVYLAKGRPSDNPLIFHISSLEMLNQLVEEFPEDAKILTEKFWPGPLTLVFKKKTSISKELTSGLDTIAIRMPNNEIALKLISKSNTPIVAPSANTSGKPSPTKAEHVYDDLNGKVDMILDGGSTKIGLESTVVDISSKPYIILRPGKITYQELKEVLSNNIQRKERDKSKNPKSPGMKYKHYAPSAKVILINSQEEYKEEERTILLKYSSQEEMAKSIFNDFRKADKNKIKEIYVIKTELKGLGEAIMNRVEKAVSKK